MRHAFWRMCHQKTAPDSTGDIKKETIMAMVLRLALISVVVSLLTAVPPVYAEPRKHSTSKLWTFADTEAVPGARSRLFRSDDKICMNINNRTLTEGAYTVWWFVFNSPEHCTSPAPVGGARCGSGDQLLNTPVNFSAVWATGGIAGPDGVGYFSACLEENTLPEPPQSQDVDGAGLADTQGAEIHLAVRFHCAAEYGTPALLGAQITRFGGGCTAETGGDNLAWRGIALAPTSNSPFIRRKRYNARATMTIKGAIFTPSLRR
jgi:hypothetical protein